MHDYCCEDCLFYLTYDQVPEQLTADQVYEYKQEVNRRTEGFHAIPDTDHESDFSTAQCDICGSTLAGYRCRVTFLEV